MEAKDMANQEGAGRIFGISAPTRERTAAPVLPRPDVRIAPLSPEPGKRPKSPEKHISKKARIALAGLAALGAVETTGAVITEQTNNQPLSTRTIPADLAWPWNLGKSAVEDIKGFFNRNKTTSYEGSLAPKESASWWKELSTEEIQKLAEIPSINIIEKDISKINPVLQQKATKAGYEIIYQGDPNDITGRTIVAKGRQLIDEDLGFGLDGDGFNVRGIFKHWVSDPNDPNQQKQIYAILVDPITNKEYTIAVELFPDTGGEERTTWFAVDDLNIGIDEVNRRAQEPGGYKDGTYLLPDSNAPGGTRHKKVTDFPTVNDLVRKEGIKLTDLIAPGDYVAAILQTAGTPIDSKGVRKTILLTVRRFGGTTEWKKENGLQ